MDLESNDEPNCIRLASDRLSARQRYEGMMCSLWLPAHLHQIKSSTLTSFSLFHVMSLLETCTFVKKIFKVFTDDALLCELPPCRVGGVCVPEMGPIKNDS